MRATFKNIEINIKFQSLGYAIVPFLNGEAMSNLEETVNHLLDVGDHESVHIQAGYKLTLFNKDTSYKRDVFQTLLPIIKVKTDEIVDNYEIYSINIFSKEPGDRFTSMHCNATLINESIASSVSFWIPLNDTNATNSTLEVVESSQKLIDPMRPLNCPRLFDDSSEKIRKLFKPLNVKKGQCVVIDDSLIHWTNDNNSDKTRTAVQVVMYPKEMEPHTYHYKIEDKILQKYKSSNDFVINSAWTDKPDDGLLIEEFRHTFRVYSEEELIEILTKKLSEEGLIFNGEEQKPKNSVLRRWMDKIFGVKFFI